MDPEITLLRHRATALKSAEQLAAKGDKIEPAEAAREFEAMLLGELMKDATQPLDEEGAIGNSPGTRMYQELFLEEVLRRAEGRLGLAQWIESRLTSTGAEGDER